MNNRIIIKKSTLQIISSRNYSFISSSSQKNASGFHLIIFNPSSTYLSYQGNLSLIYPFRSCITVCQDQSINQLAFFFLTPLCKERFTRTRTDENKMRCQAKNLQLKKNVLTCKKKKKELII